MKNKKKIKKILKKWDDEAKRITETRELFMPQPPKKKIIKKCIVIGCNRPTWNQEIGRYCEKHGMREPSKIIINTPTPRGKKREK